MLPYRDVRRGDIIVFRYPLNISEDYVKRAIGVPGDHIRLVNKQLMLNGHLVNEPYVSPQPDRTWTRIATISRRMRDSMPLRPRAAEMLEKHVVNGELVVPPGYIFAMGDNRDDSRRQPLLGLRAAREYRRHAGDHLLDLRGAHRGPDQRRTSASTTSWTW